MKNNYSFINPSLSAIKEIVLTSQTFNFRFGKHKRAVDYWSASAIMKVYNGVDERSKKTIEEMISNSFDSFIRIEKICQIKLGNIR